MALTEVSAFKNLSIINEDINGSAAIDGSKISPIFGSQDITTTGDVKINSLSKSLQVGDITNDNYAAIQQVSASTVRGFTVQHSNASVFENLQGGTNQHIVLGDVNTNSSTTLFGVSITSGGTFTRLSLSGSGNLNVHNNNTLGGTVDGVDIAARDTLFGALTSSSGVLTNGVTATTQSANDNSTKIATTAYVDGASGGGSASTLVSPDGTTKVEATNSSVEVKDSFRIDDSSPSFSLRNANGSTYLGQISHSGGTHFNIQNRVAGGDFRFMATSGSSGTYKILFRNTGGGTGHPDVYIGQAMTTTEDGSGNGKPTGLNAMFPASGGVELYHISGSTGTKKFETTANGITVQGSVTTEDINMSNLNASANEVDNTKGSWTIQEGASDLFLINRVNGKKYKFNLTEIS